MSEPLLIRRRIAPRSARAQLASLSPIGSLVLLLLPCVVRATVTAKATPPVVPHALHASGAPQERPPSLTLFLNRRGGRFTWGRSDSARNTSSLVPRGQQPVEISPFAGSDEEWAAVTGCLNEQFAPYRVIVTESEPARGSYMEVVVGDVPQRLGLSSKTVGIAPMDASGKQVIERAVVFVFSQRIGEARTHRICEVAAQEVGHALGLDHAYLCEDPMSYLRGCGAKTFQNADVPCGEHAPRRCRSGAATQNTVAHLARRLGIRQHAALPPTRVAPDGMPPPTPGETQMASQAPAGE